MQKRLNIHLADSTSHSTDKLLNLKKNTHTWIRNKACFAGENTNISLMVFGVFYYNTEW